MIETLLLSRFRLQPILIKYFQCFDSAKKLENVLFWIKFSQFLWKRTFNTINFVIQLKSYFQLVL